MSIRNVTPSGGLFVGAHVRLTVDLAGEDGQPITGAAGSLALTVRAPQEDPDVLNDVAAVAGVAGRYEVVYRPAAAGLYRVKWVYDGALDGVGAATFVVTDPG